MRHHFLTKWRLIQYKMVLVECFVRGSFNENHTQKKLKKLSRSSFFKSPQFYIDIIILFFHPYPYFDPEYTVSCVNATDRT